MASFTVALLLCCSSMGAMAAQLELKTCQISLHFDEYMRKHNRSYLPGSKEYIMRQGLYDSTVASINHHNCKPGNLWKRGINKFADRTPKELEMFQGERPIARKHRANAHALTLTQQDKHHKVPDEVDWSNLTAMSDVQDQGSCGSCWAVAALTVLRAHAEIWRGDSRMLSVQQLVSCVENKHHCGGGGGCQGATAELALTYVKENGIVHAADFPYQEKDLKCPDNLKTQNDASFLSTHKAKRGNGVDSVGMSDFTILPENKMAPVMRALYENGPVKASIAVPQGFFTYASGIMDGCPKDAVITHGAVVIGYGEDKATNQKFWKLQNSWGKEWGENGHFKFLRRDESFEESDQSCGWDRQPEKGNGCDGGPDKIKVCGMCGILSNVVVPKMIAQGGMSATMTSRQQSPL